MARKPAQKDTRSFTPPPSPQREVRRAQVDIGFDNQSLLGALFGQFDANLVQVENRLGVFISARGNQLAALLAVDSRRGDALSQSFILADSHGCCVLPRA